MHALTKLRRTTQEHRQQFRGETSLRPLLTGGVRGGLTAGDLEGLETVPINGQNEDGSFVWLDGYDNIDDLIVTGLP